MKKLMKYELRKTLAPKLILLGITAVAEIAYLIGILLKDEDWTLISAGILTMLAIGGVMMIGLMSVVTLHRDINTKQSYMLFMTPNSSYKILGAKVLENGLSILLTGACFFGLGALDITLLFARFDMVADLWYTIESVLRSIDQRIQADAAGMACFFLNLLAGWFTAVTAAYLADVISAALLNGKKHNGILSFIVFLALMFALRAIQGLTAGALPAGTSINVVYLLRSAISLIYSGLMYVGTAEIMERRLSV